jgi:hypothetical protein
MSLSLVEVGAYVAAGLVGASRLLSAFQPFWNKLPRVVAVALPVVVATLPLLAEKAGLIKTDVDLVALAVTAVALLVPGIAEATAAPPAA